MHDFLPGQRWLNDAELKLGLGTVVATQGRTVTISFPGSGEKRNYARDSAPLTRVVFSEGDRLRTRDGIEIQVTAVIEKNGLLSYTGKDASGDEYEIDEVLLDDRVQLNRPSDRLLNGQIDRDSWFQLRFRSLAEIHRLGSSPLRGLSGCRVSLIPHQLYIAHEVATRYAPRVLLADEVGLGKTIEAGLILHRQMVTERAQRILILTPESLVHQWLVEMLRRFNMHFSIFDPQRYQSIIEGDPDQNPFHNEQLVLASLDFMSQDPAVLQHAVAGEWDLLVVDEAHHLQWTEHAVSKEYSAVEKLAAVIPGVLLLTATPEQLGKSGHFARLRLLDPERFPDFDKFVEEEKNYEPVANAIEMLFNQPESWEQAIARIIEALGESERQSLEAALDWSPAKTPGAEKLRSSLVEHLLDRHGTGRVLFRNTRAAVSGFPQRKLHPARLPLPPEYDYVDDDESPADMLLTPERVPVPGNNGAWGKFDPRVSWLLEKLAELDPERLLVICASSDTALELAEILRKRTGQHLAVFHEGMSIVERDRAAAYFADPEEGCQALICSEIGSEGRNFQFAHHLVLFDLPINPDLLEQRIGRLDRIGQSRTVHIHVPYMENSAQTVYFQWLHEGLNAFERPCPAGALIQSQMETRLVSALHQPTGNHDGLIRETQQALHEMERLLEKGRDRLLEYNSCRPDVAMRLVQQAEREDIQSTLHTYMDAIFDCFGVHCEEHSRGLYIIRPTENMLMAFPFLKEDGMTICYQRDIALSHEDVHYLSWDHPMVTASMDMVLSSELGNTSLIAVEYEALKPGRLFMESVFSCDCLADRTLTAGGFLPTTSIRIVVDEEGADLTSQLDHELLNRHREPVDRETAKKIVAMKTSAIRGMTRYSQENAQQQAASTLTRIREQTTQILQRELRRLETLSIINPNVRQEEIDFFRSQLDKLHAAFDKSGLRLDAMRIIIST